MIALTVNSVDTLTGAPAWLQRKLRDRLTFDNPQWIENEKRRFWNGNTPKQLCYLRDDGDRLTMPRGFTRQACELLRACNVQYRLDDRRRVLAEVDFHFTGTLRDYQHQALDNILKRDFGTVSAPTGSGKTVISLAAIAARRQPALIVVHTKELADQWVSRIEAFLNVTAGEVGVIGNGRHVIGEKITVALAQSLVKVADQVAPSIGHLIVDECHRTPSKTFTEVVSRFDCKYMLGLSATPFRRDRLSRLIYWFLGDLVHKIDREPLVDSGDLLEAEVVMRETSFRPTVDPSTEYSTMLSELTKDPARNEQIITDVVRESRNGFGVCLVLSDRKSHCHALADLLELRGVKAEVLTGELGRKDRQEIVERLNAGRVKVLIATGQLIGEGFDCKQLSTLFFACPIKFSGRLLQYIGRVLRPAPGKSKARIFDYQDKLVGVLMAAARARRRVYEKRAA